ncbi:aspartate/glutamate racemase family protein [Pseudomonas chlororaphis]|uniref:aspartate/glutamate racemase family protein n=1 Tax=Pseudomonas chlororaphis TaxID=587753 RepID=UPI002366EEF5|nr:aspartate/glutamate racemase family protein [Pseudomonas chlororaphis]WDH22898.1 aspartate/glutamate racemase family protein [Pseudomonas chlororaphis]
MSMASHKLGVLMLNTRFPRPMGDIGHSGSFTCPVEFLTVPYATPGTVVSHEAIQPHVVQGFIEGAQSLIESGCTLITTSCGFACAIHDELERAIPVPFVSSALNLIPTLAKQYGWHTTLPVITYDGRVLSKRHFGRFWSNNVVIQGIEAGQELYSVIKNDCTVLNTQLAEQDVIDSVAMVLERYPSSKAIVFECTNLPPYRQAVEKRFGLPVYDIFSALDSVTPHLQLHTAR